MDRVFCSLISRCATGCLRYSASRSRTWTTWPWLPGTSVASEQMVVHAGGPLAPAALGLLDDTSERHPQGSTLGPRLLGHHRHQVAPVAGRLVLLSTRVVSTLHFGSWAFHKGNQLISKRIDSPTKFYRSQLPRSSEKCPQLFRNSTSKSSRRPSSRITGKRLRSAVHRRMAV